jgi:hypothetical protein
MNASALINQWIKKGKPYKEGIALYDQFGSNQTLKGLFHKFQSSFYFNKLTQELAAIKNESEIVNIITPVELQKPVKESKEPIDRLRALDKKKAELFKSILQTRKEIKSLLKLKTNGRISIADALKIMTERDSKGRLKPFSVTYVSYNASRKTGGDVIRFDSCILRIENNTGSKIMMGKKYYKGNQPRHWINSTRNFWPVGAHKDEVRKLHNWLMFEFNGMEVVANELG